MGMASFIKGAATTFFKEEVLPAAGRALGSAAAGKATEFVGKFMDRTSASGATAPATGPAQAAPPPANKAPKAGAPRKEGKGPAEQRVTGDWGEKKKTKAPLPEADPNSGFLALAFHAALQAYSVFVAPIVNFLVVKPVKALGNLVTKPFKAAGRKIKSWGMLNKAKAIPAKARSVAASLAKTKPTAAKTTTKTEKSDQAVPYEPFADADTGPRDIGGEHISGPAQKTGPASVVPGLSTRTNTIKTGGPSKGARAVAHAM